MTNPVVAPVTLFQKIQAEIKKFEEEAGADLSAIEAKFKSIFESHAATPEVAAAPPAVAAVLDTTPAAPTGSPASPAAS